MTSLKLLCLLLVASLCACAKLPSSFKKCNRRQTDFSSCLSDAIEDAVRQLTQPFKEVGLPSLEPLEISSLTLDAGNGPVAFKQNYKNIKVSGFSKIRCPKADVDFKKNVIFVSCLTPSVKMDFDYEINGRLLLLPISGKGPGSITLEDLQEDFIFNLEEYQKKNKKYYRVVSNNITMTPQFMRFNLENLFNGDKVLGDNVLKVLNENWKDVFADVKTSYEDAFAQVFLALFNNLLGKVPAVDLFGEE